jgi:hypothetical protein
MTERYIDGGGNIPVLSGRTSTDALMQRLAERTTERDYHIRVNDQLAERVKEKDAEIKRLAAGQETGLLECECPSCGYDFRRRNYEDRHPNDMVLHPLSEIREWDEALALLGIQDSTQTPAEAIRELQAECFALAANQCHAGYGDDYGNHRCEKIDTLKDALLGLIEAVELDSDKGGKGISGYTAARLSDARAALGASTVSQAGTGS